MIPDGYFATLVRIIFAYFCKVKRGQPPEKAAGEAAKAMELQLGCSEK